MSTAKRQNIVLKISLIAETNGTGLGMGTSNNLWVTQFDNQAYEKSPEPLLLSSPQGYSTNSTNHHNKSLSLNSLNKNPNPAMLSQLNEEKVMSFDLESSASGSQIHEFTNSSGTDSDLELVNSSPVLESAGKMGLTSRHHGQGSLKSGSSNNQISRAKILETVGVHIVNKTADHHSFSGNGNSDVTNLLLPPMSSSSPRFVFLIIYLHQIQQIILKLRIRIFTIFLPITYLVRNV